MKIGFLVVLSLVLLNASADAVPARVNLQPLPMKYGDTSRGGDPYAKDPTVIRHGDRYLMYYSIRAYQDKKLAPKKPAPFQLGWHTGIAESRDLVHWTRVADMDLRDTQGRPFWSSVAPCVRKLDGKIHLYGAEWGAWRIDQRGEYYQNMGGLYDVYGPERQQALPERFPVVKYEDTDNNGFFDVAHFDWDGNQQFEEHVNLRELGIADTATIIPIAEMRCPDYEALFRRVATDTWQRAEQAQQLAHSYGIDLSWYSLYRHPKTLRQQYDYGYWLQLYLYHDLLDLARRTSNPELEQTLTRAYFSSNWNLVEAAK